jgi:hypothetical protein
LQGARARTRSGRRERRLFGFLLPFAFLFFLTIARAEQRATETSVYALQCWAKLSLFIFGSKDDGRKGRKKGKESVSTKEEKEGKEEKSAWVVQKYTRSSTISSTALPIHLCKKLTAVHRSVDEEEEGEGGEGQGEVEAVEVDSLWWTAGEEGEAGDGRRQRRGVKSDGTEERRNDEVRFADRSRHARVPRLLRLQRWSSA